MKRALLLVLAVLALLPSVMAGDKDKKKSSKAGDKVEAVAGDKEIRWMSLDDAQVAMKKAPKKVYMDVYTDWCGWCKVMEKKTFSNPDVIKYINENMYAVRFNAEQKDSIRFIGKMYGYAPDRRVNDLAAELMRNQLSYPTSVVLEENFQNPVPIPGYLDVPTMEKILKYFVTNNYKSQKFPDFEKGFTPSWTVLPAPGSEAPVAH